MGGCGRACLHERCAGLLNLSCGRFEGVCGERYLTSSLSFFLGSVDKSLDMLAFEWQGESERYFALKPMMQKRNEGSSMLPEIGLVVRY
jgi:hypothetical protein